MAGETQQGGKALVFFWKVDEEFGAFSQWYRSPFTYDGKTFTTMEQFMMYKKAMVFGDETMANKILTSSGQNPRAHKSMGRKVKNFDDAKWNRVGVQVVVDGSFHKFVQNPELAKILIDTGASTLAEASRYDRIWGIGYTANVAMANTHAWGQNKLGKCLMVVRDMLRERNKLVIAKELAAENPIRGDVVRVCYFCTSATMVRAMNRDTTRHTLIPVVTTCVDCVQTHHLAFGWLNRHEVMTMLDPILRHAEINEDTHEIVEKETFSIVHPKMATEMCPNDSVATLIRSGVHGRGDLQVPPAMDRWTRP
ncbi:uncharacterized protein N7459_008239 [Penicillium hispanicum]|uniref:uncharacterized protein n=1 Tax=Penicillium hispanicum TaxID=1080232 RepID=UPI0025406EE2|nr:uncharacterized protein N7459_008239 [Penicillium hispanicum]KAJ5573812.1 hypothetical protein N7459_008239 [Penicillium hispanicum]